MNKICCFLTGGHRYKDSDLEVKFNDDECTVTFSNRCNKCGNLIEVTVPQNSILRDFHKENLDG